MPALDLAPDLYGMTHGRCMIVRDVSRSIVPHKSENVPGVDPDSRPRVTDHRDIESVRLLDQSNDLGLSMRESGASRETQRRLTRSANKMGLAAWPALCLRPA
jgi:hypothetical protein